MEEIIRDVSGSTLERLQRKFERANPFKHVLIENFLTNNFIAGILDEFPRPPSADKLVNEFGGKSSKHAVHDIKDLGPHFNQWHNLLQSTEFIAWLSQLTGIPDLIFDPEYHGAGTHNNMHGQGMDVHVDFNLHRSTGFHRRLNLIVYLNEGWEDDWGGGLSLHKDPWTPDTDEWKTYPCSINNAILFETNEVSWHGFETIDLPEKERYRSRKSLTVYYYTKSRPAHEIAPKHSTIYVQKPIPRHLKPGVTLSEKDCNNLRHIIRKRNNYLRGMYNRESQLLKRIEGFKHRIKVHENNYKLPTVGFVRQMKSPEGILPNGKMVENIKTTFEIVKPFSRISLKGTVPSFVNKGKNTLTLKLDKQIIEGKKNVKGSFKTSWSFNGKKGRKLEFDLSCEHFLSPKEAGINQDRTSFGIFLLEIVFE